MSFLHKVGTYHVCCQRHYPDIKVADEISMKLSRRRASATDNQIDTLLYGKRCRTATVCLKGQS